MHHLLKILLCLQSEGCLVLQVLDEAKELLKAYLACFIKREVLKTPPELLEINYTEPEKQVSDNDLDLGIAARRYLCEIEDDCTPDTIHNFYSYKIISLIFFDPIATWYL